MLPTGDEVDVPVITNISFIDPAGRYQETQYTIDNSSLSGRETHVDIVYSSEEGATSSGGLEVERIDLWPVFDSSDRAQETQISLDNVTGADTLPPRFTTHAQTHVVRYYKDPANKDDNGPWIDVEVIDQLSVVDGADRGQETQLYLEWLDEQADPADPEISDPGGETAIDPPWRIDPFQNIIDWFSSEWIIVNFIIQSSYTDAAASGATTPIPRSTCTANFYLTGYQTQLFYDGTTALLLKSGSGPVTLGPGTGSPISWSYSGGGADVHTVPPYTYLGHGLGLRHFFPKSRPPTASPFMGYTQDAGTTHATNPWFDTLTVELDVFGYLADGPYTIPSQPDVAQCLFASTFEVSTGTNADTISTRTLDFSTITATYNGIDYSPVALISADATSIKIALKKARPTA